MNTPSPTQPKPLEGVAASIHLNNLRNFVEQFVLERGGLTGESVLRVSDVPVTCSEMSLVLTAFNLHEKELATLKRKAEMAGELAEMLEEAALAFEGFAVESECQLTKQFSRGHAKRARATLSKYKQESST